MFMKNKSITVFLEKWKLPLLILIAGLGLMLLPTREYTKEAVPDAQQALAELLSDTQGVGKARVLISENGVVVLCEGASKASVRLDIICAVSAYTGFGSDRITILKSRT